MRASAQRTKAKKQKTNLSSCASSLPSKVGRSRESTLTARLAGRATVLNSKRCSQTRAAESLTSLCFGLLIACRVKASLKRSNISTGSQLAASDTRASPSNTSTRAASSRTRLSASWPSLPSKSASDCLSVQKPGSLLHGPRAVGLDGHGSRCILLRSPSYGPQDSPCEPLDAHSASPKGPSAD